MAAARPTAWWCGCNRPPTAVMAFKSAGADVGVADRDPVSRKSAPNRAGDMAVTTDDNWRQRASARSLRTIVDFAVGSHGRAVAVLLVVALLGFLPGFFSVPPIDRDEARFAQATKQMVESGDYVDIRFQDEVRYKKPVGIYWLQAAVVKSAEARGGARGLDDGELCAVGRRAAHRQDRCHVADDNCRGDGRDGARLSLATTR